MKPRVPRALVAMLSFAMVGAAPAHGAETAGGCSIDLFGAEFSANLADRYDQTITAAVFDSAEGCLYELNSGLVVTTASIHKVEILAGALMRADAEERSLTTWELERAVAMIRFSANREATELRNAIGGTSRMREIDRLFGMSDTVATDPWGATRTTAADQIALLRNTILNENAHLSDEAVSVMVDLMLAVTGSQRWGITAGVPPDTDVAMKNGFYPLGDRGFRINSIGYVNPRGRAAYVVAILSDGWATMSSGIAAVEHVGRHVARRLIGPLPNCMTPTIAGTAGSDVLIGTDADDVIAGFGGDDVILGGGGDDVLCGGAGNDVLRGHTGDDVLRGGRGADQLAGGAGRDALQGGTGRDTLAGRSGSDSVSGNAGNDVLYGGPGRDRLYGAAGQDQLDGQDGDDWLMGAGGHDRCVDPGAYERWLVHSGCDRFR